MFYLATKLSAPGCIDMQENVDLLRQSVQQLEVLETSLHRPWKVWMTADVFDTTDAQGCVFHLNGHWQRAEMIATTAPAYLRVESQPPGSAVTVLSAHEGALGSLTALLDALYGPVTPILLDGFLQTNRSLRVQSAQLIEHQTGNTSLLTYSVTVSLGDLLSRPNMAIQSVTASIERTALPLKVVTIYLSNTTHQAGFVIADDEVARCPEGALVDGLFSLADMAFSGAALAAERVPA